ncbi:hypothetical protein QYG89_05360 [Bacillus sp. B190/17]|uniref:Tetracycline resistance protein tetM n=1 Tax=Bacillus lumedeiriae TaxID=3058829 RepID=A0ABW8I7Z0_9BACI
MDNYRKQEKRCGMTDREREERMRRIHEFWWGSCPRREESCKKREDDCKESEKNCKGWQGNCRDRK